MPLAPNFTSILEQNWEINFLQCYPNGFLKYTDLCNILQLTAGSHAELGGISFSDMQVHNQAWVLSKMHVEIDKIPKWKDVITVKTWIKSLENSRSVRCLEVYLGNEKIIGCETFWAVFNTQTRRPENLALPHEHFKKYPSCNATEIPFSKIDLNHERNFILEKKVVLSDLDIVNHANSVKYLEWCLDCVDYKLIIKNNLKSFEMNYLKEVSLHDSVIIDNFKTDISSIYTISNNNKVSFALSLNWL